MIITDEIVHVDRTPSSTPHRRTIRRLFGIGTAIVVAAAVASVAVVASSGPTRSDKAPAQTPVQVSRTRDDIVRDDIVRDLVERGLVPAPTLDDGTPITGPAPVQASRTRDDIVRDLVERGLVPVAILDDETQITNR